MTTTPPQPIHEEYRGYQLMVLVDDVAPNVWSRATVVYNGTEVFRTPTTQHFDRGVAAVDARRKAHAWIDSALATRAERTISGGVRPV